ncbi:MAG: ribonuclease H-like domain-containing protein [Planctomycetota bacterium]
MPRRYLAFDIETAKLLPEGVEDLFAHRPLGICCAAAYALDSRETMTWFGREGAVAQAGEAARVGGAALGGAAGAARIGAGAGVPAPQLSRGEARALVADLQRLVAEGYTLVTWNGAAFDFPILAEESGATSECAALAAGHVDMMFQVVCEKGHRLSLAKAAQGMALPGKLSGVSGADAPRLWASGEHQRVLAYCQQDVRLTAELAAAGDESAALLWITQRGSPAKLSLPRGWLSVREAQRLPEPDTSWMSSPPSRAAMVGWMG